MQVNIKGEDFDDEDIIMEIARLKQEQKALEQELEAMNKRLEATERRPQQMMAFIYKVVEDPDLLPRMILEKERTRQIKDKKQRLMISSSATSPSGMAISSTSTIIKSEVVHEEGSIGVISDSSGEGED
jgi:heat shock transcription factor